MDPHIDRRNGYGRRLVPLALIVATAASSCAQQRNYATESPSTVTPPTRAGLANNTPASDSAGNPDPLVSPQVDAASYVRSEPDAHSPFASALRNTIQLVSDTETTNPVDRDSSAGELASLVSQAVTRNARLRKLQQEAAAAWDRARYADALPDPMVGTNGFGHPIETAAGSQWANMTLSQRIPWLKRLDAQAQQALYEAWSLDSMYQAERLKVVADVKAGWARLYLLDQRKRINLSNQVILKSLVDTANDRIRAGGASSGDVLLGTLELSRLAEELVSIDQQVSSTTAAFNQLLNRPAETPVSIPRSLQPLEPRWALDSLRSQAFSRQPEIAAAQLNSHASRWGVDVARLSRRPDVTLNFNYFFIGDNRPPSAIVDVGQDAWSLGAMVNVPLWHGKYDAMESEAVRRHAAAAEGVTDVQRRYEALIADSLSQARAAAETAELYNATILPQARQTLEADQLSYGQGRVEFDRVISDLRNVITLDAGYHRAVAEQFTAQARLEQGVGGSLEAVPILPEPAPAADEDETP